MGKKKGKKDKKKKKEKENVFEIKQKRNREKDKQYKKIGRKKKKKQHPQANLNPTDDSGVDLTMNNSETFEGTHNTQQMSDSENDNEEQQEEIFSLQEVQQSISTTFPNVENMNEVNEFIQVDGQIDQNNSSIENNRQTIQQNMDGNNTSNTNNAYSHDISSMFGPNIAQNTSESFFYYNTSILNETNGDTSFIPNNSDVSASEITAVCENSRLHEQNTRTVEDEQQFCIPMEEFWTRNVEQRRISGFEKTFGKNKTTIAIKTMFNKRFSPYDFLSSEIEFLKKLSNHPFLFFVNNLEDKSSFFEKMKFGKWSNLMVKQTLENYRRKEFILEHDFANHLLFFLNLRKTHITNDSVLEWNKEYSETLSEKKIDFDKYTPTYHHFYYCFCTKKYVFFKKGETCSTCKNKVLEVNRIAMLDILEWLQILFSNREFYKMTQNKKEKTENSKKGYILDIHDGLFINTMKDVGCFKLADIFLTSTLFADEIAVLQNSKKLCVVLMTFNELNGDVRQKEPYVAPVMIYQPREDNHNSIFSPLATQLEMLALKKNKISIHQYYENNGETKKKKINKSINLFNIVWNKDKHAGKLVVNMKNCGAYCSCSACLIIGSIGDNNHVYFPFTGMDSEVPRRTSAWLKESLKMIEKHLLKSYGGHFGENVNFF